MSGFVINFFANELKMFTQWMGETTGIVSVPDEDNQSAKGQQVSFEGKVYDLEKYYTFIYNLCKEKIDPAKVNEMAEQFLNFFKTNDYKTKADFEFLQELRESFDKAFRNSISSQGHGYLVEGTDKKVMRFNTANSPFVNCAAETCDKCPNKEYCRAKSAAKRNIATNFTQAVKDFFDKGERFYSAKNREYQELTRNKKINPSDSRGGIDMGKWLQAREQSFKNNKVKVAKALQSFPQAQDSFTVSYAKYQEIFDPMKQLYWDEVVGYYIGMILTQFYKQCDSVLNSAGLFEKFIKTLSIADFMNNMEGNV
jgi:hypothetical protein